MENTERTLLVIKPDGVRRGLVGEILGRFEKLGLKVVGMKMLQLETDHLKKHYNKDDAWFKKMGEGIVQFWEDHGKDAGEDFGTTDLVELGKNVQTWLFDYMMSGPVVAIILEGPNAVQLVRKHVGSTYPAEAAPGTIRGDYHTDSQEKANLEKRAAYNMVHSSGNKEEAEFEIKLWFHKNEIFS